MPPIFNTGGIKTFIESNHNIYADENDLTKGEITSHA